MPSSVYVNETENYIEIKSYGIVTKEGIAKSLAKVKEYHKSMGINNIIIDTTEQDKMPNAIEIIELASTFPRGIKFALIAEESQSTSKDIHFVETASINRGVDVKSFYSKRQAIQWLVDK